MKIRDLIVCAGHELKPIAMENGRMELCVALAGSWKSRDMTVTEKELQQMIEAFTEEGRDLLFDVDHKSLGGLLSEADSRAAGWGKAMRLDDGKIYVEMEPTAFGKTLIENGEYRYLSPVYQLQRADRVTGKTLKTWRLHSVALTNTPFLTELPAIKNKDNGGNPMDELLKMLGATDEDGAIAKVKELSAAKTTAEAKLATANEAMNTVNAKLNTQEVEMAIANKKLLPADKELALALINSDRKLYDKFVNSRPPADLTTPETVETSAADGAVNLDNVKTFRELLSDPALDKRMAEERPDRWQELYDAHMKEGV
jgi:phage I-like protein